MLSDKALAVLDRLAKLELSESFESLLTSKHGFGLVTATPLQRAICRLVDGRELGDLAGHSDIVSGLGTETIPEVCKPNHVVIVSGIRVGKSLMAAALAVWWSQTCDVSKIGPGEIPRVSVLSVNLDLANVVFSHLLGHIMSKPHLKALLLEDPKADSVLLKHPSGKPIEVKVIAGAKAGSTLVARWSAGCIFDEAPRLSSEEEAVVSFDECFRAVYSRRLPGAQIVSIGSPHAPFGPIYDAVTESFGKPDATTLVIKAPGWLMNDVFWTPKRVEELRTTKPDVYLTECAAEFKSPEESLFGSIEIDRCTRTTPLELEPLQGAEYFAAIDPATRGNSWTLTVVTRTGNLKRVVLARQWTGSRIEPLSPRAVLSETALILKKYGVFNAFSDQWSGDALRDIAREFGLNLIQLAYTEKEKSSKWDSLKAKVLEGEIELSPEPYLRNDLLRVRKVVTQTGTSIKLPKTSDGRHCDYAPALLLALDRYLNDVEKPKPEPGTNEAIKAEMAEVLERTRMKFAPQHKKRWW